jgi:hypothetical protein
MKRKSKNSDGRQFYQYQQKEQSNIIVWWSSTRDIIIISSNVTSCHDIAEITQFPLASFERFFIANFDLKK